MADTKQTEQINGFSTEESDNNIKKNGETARLLDIDDDSSSTTTTQEETLHTVAHRIFTETLSSDPDSKEGRTATSLFQRIKKSIRKNAPVVPEASRNSASNLLVWTRRGSALRALLVISVGTIVLLALTGLLVFMLFFLAATINAIIISLLMSLAAAGGFLAIFFACMTAIYICALSVAVFVISSATITTIFAVMVATGWVGFFWTVWMATRKSMDLAKHSINMTGSALTAYSAARQPNQTTQQKVSD